jgi:hypothetical protein
MRPLSATVVAISAAVLFACTTVDPDPLPQGNYATPIPGKTVAFFPISVSIDDLERQANAFFPAGKVFEGAGRDGNSREFDYQLYRNDPITIRVVGYRMLISIPLYAEAHGTQIICYGYWHHGKCHGAKDSEHASTEAKAEGIVLLNLKLNPDYSASVQTQDTIELRDNPHLHMDLFGNLIRININLTDAIKSALNRQIPKIATGIQTEINARLADLKLNERVNEYWSQLNGAMEVNDFWISLAPEAVIFRGFHSDPSGRNLKVGLGFSGDVRVSLTKPTPVKHPLPPVQPTTLQEGVFTALIPVYTTFEQIEENINTQFVGRRFEDEDYYIEVRGIQLRGVHFEGENAILAKIKFVGGRKSSWYDPLLKTVRGNLYFTGVPSYDPANRLLYVLDFKLTTDTSSEVVNEGVPWLALLKYDDIRAKLQYELGPVIDEMKGSIQKRLDDGVNIGALKLTGTIQQLDLGDFT